MNWITVATHIGTLLLGAGLTAATGLWMQGHQEDRAAVQEACTVLPEVQRVKEGARLSLRASFDLDDLPKTPVLDVASEETRNLPLDVRAPVLLIAETWMTMIGHHINFRSYAGVSESESQRAFEKMQEAARDIVGLAEKVSPALRELCEG